MKKQRYSSMEQDLFNSLDEESRGYIVKKQFISALNRVGIRLDDPRLSKTKELLSHFKEGDKIHYNNFVDITKNNLALIENILTGNLIIPGFKNFRSEIDKIYNDCKKASSGKVADYIPQLARVNPNFFGISLCTINGQMHSIGDTLEYFSMQSVCKPIIYCLVQEEHGENMVHKHIGKEPSGHSFNTLALNEKNLPHNPLINAGAIAACSLFKTNLDSSDRFDFLMNMLESLCGGLSIPRFNNAIYLSEKNTADRNFAIAHFMKEKKVFPPGADLNDILDFYFQCCSIEMTTEGIAMIAATLANAGICPLTEKKIFSPNTVKNCLSLMYSCGMYDFSGEFAFSVGLPAKSGVSGGLMVVVPNVMGICIWSPLIDRHGNSVRGLQFCKELVKKFNFHNYDSLVRTADKTDPRRKETESKFSNVISLIWAAALGDMTEVKHLVAAGVDMNGADYDGRTALHLAASEGQTEIVKYFITKKIELNPIDRWGHTPLDDAFTHHNKEVITLLEDNGAIKKRG